MCYDSYEENYESPEQAFHYFESTQRKVMGGLNQQESNNQ